MLGTSAESIDRAEDRERWNALCAQLEIPQPAGGTATDGRRRARRSPSASATRCSCARRYVLGGRAMQIVYDDDELAAAMAELADFG